MSPRQGGMRGARDGCSPVAAGCSSISAGAATALGIFAETGGALLRAALRAAGPVGSVGLVAFWLGGCGSRQAPDPVLGRGGRAVPIRSLAAEIDYDVRALENADELAIEATITGLPGSDFIVDQGAAPFVEHLEAEGTGPAAEAVAVRATDRAVFRVPECARGACRLRYRFALGRAAQALDDLDVAAERGGAYLAPPSTWLLRPSLLLPTASVHLRVRVPPKVRFATGLFSSIEDQGAFDDQGAFAIPAIDLPEAPYSAFGKLRLLRLPAGQSHVEIAVVPGRFGVTDDALADWIGGAATTVERYLGRFPAPHVLVLVVPIKGSRIGYATTLGNGGASILVPVGIDVDASTLTTDWVMTHEMVHVAFPTLTPRHPWLAEGIATYVEPIARARRGLLSDEQVWRGMIDGLPHGLPGRADRGLERTPTWGRTYWGGALYCLLADIRIRQRTGGRRSFDDALRAIVAAGGNVSQRWTLDHVLDEGDRATGVPVLRELYAEMGFAPTSVDLARLFRELGVTPRGAGVAFDDRAPLAALRRAITKNDGLAHR